MMSMAPLLVHSVHVPSAVREALRAAIAAPETERARLLEGAAHALYRTTDLDCRDAHELVGLAGDCGCR